VSRGKGRPISHQIEGRLARLESMAVGESFFIPKADQADVAGLRVACSQRNIVIRCMKMADDPIQGGAGIRVYLQSKGM